MRNALRHLLPTALLCVGCNSILDIRQHHLAPDAGASVAQGGTSNVATGGASNTGGQSNTGGGQNQQTCVTNGDCMGAVSTVPYLCKGGHCVQLQTSSCPVLIPQATAVELLRRSAPIIVGGFSNMTNSNDPHSTQAIVNWDLAFDEFNTRTLGGLPSYQAGGLQRPLLGLVCQGSNNSDIVGTMAHLTQDVGVSAVLTTLTTNDLYTAWSTTSADQSTFFMNTGSGNLVLINSPNGGMLWHMLGDPHVLAAPVVTLLHQMEPYLYAQRKAAYQSSGLDNPDITPLRVTLVYSTHPTMLDLHDVLTATDNKYPASQLTFNGKSCVENGSNYREVKIDSLSVVPTPNVDTAVQDLNAHPPHVIVAMATGEFPTGVMDVVEQNWGTGASSGQIRPFYLLSQTLYNSSQLLSVVANRQTLTPPLSLRTAGINYAQAQDAHSQGLYDTYETRLTSSYTGQGVLSLGGSCR